MEASGDRRTPRSLCTLTIPFVLAAALAPSGGRAHTPITTKILFNREVIRILKENCLACHRPGGIAPMSLATYEEARPWAKAIKEELLERRMPPWNAVRGFGEFRNAPRLTQRDVDAIVNWVEGGAPRGDPKQLPPEPPFSNDWAAGQPDLVLTPARPHTIAPDADDRRDFVLPTGLRAERWMTAADLRPGDASVVHCAALYLEGPRPALLSTWVPGLRATVLPEGVARKIPARSRLRVRIHYRGSGRSVADRTSIGLYLAATRAPRELRQLSLSTQAPDPPLRGTVRLHEAAEAVAIVPRAGPRLASVQATVYRPDGTTEVLVWTRDHLTDWQPTYYFKTPVDLPRGARVDVVAHLADMEESVAHAGKHADGKMEGEPLLTLFYTTAAGPKPRSDGPSSR